MTRLVCVALSLFLMVTLSQAHNDWHVYSSGDDDDGPHEVPTNGFHLNGQIYDGWLNNKHDGLPDDGDLRPFGIHGDGDYDDDDDNDDEVDHSSDDIEVASGSGDDHDMDGDYMGPSLPNMNKGCVDGCTKCIFGMCSRCKKGYRKTMFMTCVRRETNKKTCGGISHCRQCSGMAWFKSCKRCEKGWYKHAGEFDVKKRCVKRCPRGYQGKNSKKGAFCEKVIPDGCVDQYCTMCKKGYYMLTKNGNQECHKQCPAGYHPMGKSYCNKCNLRGCKKCSSALKCDKCAKKLSLFTRVSWGAVVSTRCLRRCPRGYQKELVKGKGSVCQQVCFVTNCQRCPQNGHSGLHHHCNSCKPGYHLLHGQHDECVKNCPKGYYPKETHIGTICRKGPHPTTSSLKHETTTQPDLTTMAPWPTTQEPKTAVEPEPTTTEPGTSTKAVLMTTEPEPTTTKPDMTTEPELMTMAPEPIIGDPDFSEPALGDEP